MVDRMMVSSLLVLVLLTGLSMLLPSTEGKSAYEVLESYNFPRGILPENAKDYVLNPDGSFQVFLDGQCTFRIEEGYQLRYDTTISGNISPGSLKDLRGVSVKLSFIWLDISAVKVVESGKIRFYVGRLSAAFSTSTFKISPACDE